MNQYYISNNGMLKSIKEQAGLILFLGLLLIILGSLAIIFTFTSTLLTVVYLGALLCVTGVIEAIKAFAVKKWSSFFLHLLLSVLYLVGGAYIIAYPMLNALTLTLVFAALFVASGIFKMLFAALKSSSLPHPVWIFVSGMLSLILGILIWQQWPVSGLWVLGTFMGIDMLFTGWMWIMLALAAKNAP